MPLSHASLTIAHSLSPKCSFTCNISITHFSLLCSSFSCSPSGNNSLPHSHIPPCYNPVAEFYAHNHRYHCSFLFLTSIPFVAVLSSSLPFGFYSLCLCRPSKSLNSVPVIPSVIHFCCYCTVLLFLGFIPLFLPSYLFLSSLFPSSLFSFTPFLPC